MASRSTRSGSASGPPLDFGALHLLITGMEEKIMARLDKIESKISAIDDRLDLIQAEQLRVKTVVDQLKDTICVQQNQIEGMENHVRRFNAIFVNVPESDVRTSDGESLDNDLSKISYLCKEAAATSEFEPKSIVSCARLGYPKKGHTRLIKVVFSSQSTKSEVLRSQRSLRDRPEVARAFGRVFVNHDSTPLARKENRRIRSKLKELQAAARDDDSIYIRHGVLYKNKVVVDKFNIANQLF